MPNNPQQPKPSGRISDVLSALTNRDDYQDSYHIVLTESISRIEMLLEETVAAIGSESQDQYGRPIGTGVVGRIMRLEKRVAGRFAFYEGLAKYGAGALAAATVLGAVIWWLVKNKMQDIFG